MGIDISNSLLVGAYYKDLEDFIENNKEASESEQEFLDFHFNRASPYYDADLDDCFYGFKIQNYAELTEDWWAITKTIAEDFEKLTGVKPIIRGGANVW